MKKFCPNCGQVIVHKVKPAKQPNKKHSSKKGLYRILIGIALVVILGGVFLYRNHQNQEAAAGYELVKLDGVPCLIEASQGPQAVYFKSSSLAQEFTAKYKHDKNFREKIMNLED